MAHGQFDRDEVRYEKKENETKRGNRLGEVERHLNEVHLELRKQGLRLQGVVGILGLGMVAEDGSEQVFGNVKLSCFYGSGACPQGTGCRHRVHVHRKSGSRSRHELFKLIWEGENKGFLGESTIGCTCKGQRVLSQLAHIGGGLAMGIGVPEIHEASVVDGGCACRLPGLAPSH